METIDIVSLIENNPITKLTNDYNNKLLYKIKNEFTNDEQQLFLTSFYCYLNYHPTNYYVIDLDNVWKWLGFSTKQKATNLLLKHFSINVDYVNSLNLKDKQDLKKHGGQNREIIIVLIKYIIKYKICI